MPRRAEKSPMPAAAEDDNIPREKSALLLPGTRVRLRFKPTSVTLRTAEGTVIAQDEWDDYVIVHMDEPATYQNADGTIEPLPDISVMVDSLDVLSRHD